MPEVTLSAIAIYVGAMVLLYGLGKALSLPIKIVGRLILSAVLGGLALFVLNFLGKYIGIRVGINPLTALTAGFLGLPGIMVLVLIQYIILL